MNDVAYSVKILLFEMSEYNCPSHPSSIKV